MAKHLSGHAKKWLMIIGISVFILGGGYGGYVWYQQNRTVQAPVSEQAKKEAASYNIAGDEDIAARYVELMKADKTAEAQRVFTEQVGREKDTQKKVDLYLQNIGLAMSLQKTDAALEAANHLVEVRPSHDSYAQVANVYIARHDTAQQIVYLEKATNSLKDDGNVPNKDDLLSMYQSQLDAAREWAALKEKNDW